jgi:hypothetical protein
MKRRYYLVRVVAAGLIAAAYPVWRSLAPPYRITQSVSKQIRAGMTRQEVEALIGVPPGDFPPGGSVKITFYRNQNVPSAWDKSELWRGRDTAIAVYFDHDGKVVLTQVGRNSLTSLLDRIRLFLGL